MIKFITRATDEDGVLYVRNAPCVCKSCIEESWEICENKNMWTRKIIQAKGFREIKENHLRQQLSNNTMTVEAGHYEIAAIHGRRLEEGETEYCVEWEGYGKEEWTWVNADDLDCDELIEDWEIENTE